MNDHWGSQVNLQLSAPSRMHEPEVREWWTTMRTQRIKMTTHSDIVDHTARCTGPDT